MKFSHISHLPNEERQSEEPCILIRYKSFESCWFSRRFLIFILSLNEVFVEILDFDSAEGRILKFKFGKPHPKHLFACAE